MKKLILSLVFVLALVIPSFGGVTYFKSNPTGGTVDDLDGVDASGITDGSRAIVISKALGYTYTYTYDIDNGGTESSPDLVAPDKSGGIAYVGDGRWVLSQIEHPVIDIRAHFTDNGTVTPYTIIIGPARYNVKDKYCYWTSNITSNAVGTPSDNTWYYLYLDYSEITSRDAISSADKFYWSATPPTAPSISTYWQWLNGDDRCIFAIKTDNGGGTNLKFSQHKDRIAVETVLILNTYDSDGIEAFDFKGPTFTSRGILIFSADPNGDTSPTSFQVVEEGVYFNIASISANIYDGPISGTCEVYVDESHEISVGIGSVGDATIVLYNNGFYLPEGM